MSVQASNERPRIVRPSVLARVRPEGARTRTEWTLDARTRESAQPCGNHNRAVTVEPDMTATCSTGCTTPVAGQRLCRRCARNLRQTLNAFIPLIDELTVAITRQSAVVAGAERPSHENPILFNIEAANHYRHIQRVLDYWINQIRARRAFVPIDPKNQLAWLANKTKEIGQLNHAGDFYHDVIALHRNTLTVIDQPDDKTRFPVGPCPTQTDEGDRCAGNVWAIIPATRDRSPVLSCRECGTEWEAQQWARVGRQILAAKC